MIVLRQEIGDVLRDQRTLQGRTLRQVSADARVSLGYLSEVERGQKEASSELLSSICGALDLPLSRVLQEVTRRVAATEGVELSGLLVPDTVPPELSEELRDRQLAAPKLDDRHLDDRLGGDDAPRGLVSSAA